MKEKIKLKETNTEPIIDSDNYNISLSVALNYYNEQYQLSDYKNNAIDYAYSIGINIPRSTPEQEFRNIGAVCRLLLRNQFISIKHINFVLDVLNTLKDKKGTQSSEIVETPQVSRKKPVDNTEIFLGWLDDLVVEYILTLTKKDISINDIRIKYSNYTFNKTESKKIVDWVDSKIKSYTSDYTDYNKNEELKEAYGEFTRPMLKKLCTLLTEFKETLAIVVTNTPKRVQKTIKQKPATILVSKMSYVKDHGTIKGLHPKDVVGKKIVFIFDTDTRDFIVLYSTASKFSASGMSFTNLDEAKCVKKKIRKPDEFFTALGMMQKTKEELLSLFNSIKTTQQKSTPRINETKLILGAF